MSLTPRSRIRRLAIGRLISVDRWRRRVHGAELHGLGPDALAADAGDVTAAHVRRGGSARALRGRARVTVSTGGGSWSCPRRSRRPFFAAMAFGARPSGVDRVGVRVRDRGARRSSRPRAPRSRTWSRSEDDLSWANSLVTIGRARGHRDRSRDRRRAAVHHRRRRVVGVRAERRLVRRLARAHADGARAVPGRASDDRTARTSTRGSPRG